MSKGYKEGKQKTSSSLVEINVVDNSHTHTHTHTHARNANERRKTGNVAYEQCKKPQCCYCFITGKDMGAYLYTKDVAALCHN